MTTSPYSIDLREKVINFLKSGKSQTEASIVFGINRMTVNKWYSRYKNEGHYLPKVRLGSKPNIDTGFFIEYVKTHPDATSEDIGRHFGISASGARYWLRRVGFSYKKKTSATWKLAERNGLNTRRL
jgi:transposase